MGAGPMMGYAAIIQQALTPRALGSGMHAPEEIAGIRDSIEQLPEDERAARFPHYEYDPNMADTHQQHGPRAPYEVQRGDTLSAIIQKAYAGEGGEGQLPPEALRRLIGGIARANNIANPDRINPGDLIDVDAFDFEGMDSYRGGGGVNPRESMDAISAALDRAVPDNSWMLVDDWDQAGNTSGLDRRGYAPSRVPLPRM
jgi:hypothetical protein